jgi:UDP-GlcNAc:undecaprenyl-phosphate GlcNAc-1-phosphate transferase
MHIFLAAFCLSIAFGLYWTPLMGKAAGRLGIVDHPDGGLKDHREAVPYLGGLAIFVSFLLTVGVFTEFEVETLGYLLSGTIILLVGLIDDFGVLTPSQKLLGQTLAALVLIKSGTFIKLEFVPWFLVVPLTVLWLVAVTNAFNIIDVIDGLAAGVGTIGALIVTLANLLAGRHAAAFLAIVLAGATIGFLRHNFHPAKIYLGDAGSLFLGFMLAALSMNAGYTRYNLLAAIGPILILGVPIFDLAFVVFIRWRKGIPVMRGSPDHFALRLLRWRLSVRTTAVVSYGGAALLGAAAILLSMVQLRWAVAMTAAVVSTGLIAGYALMKFEAHS